MAILVIQFSSHLAIGKETASVAMKALTDTIRPYRVPRFQAAIQGSPLSRGAVTGEHGRARPWPDSCWGHVVCRICRVLLVWLSTAVLEVPLFRCVPYWIALQRILATASFLLWALLLCWPRQQFPAYSWVLTWAPMSFQRKQLIVPEVSDQSLRPTHEQPWI